jgi:hypothetical protein
VESLIAEKRVEIRSRFHAFCGCFRELDLLFFAFVVVVVVVGDVGCRNLTIASYKVC